jgi:hypothetical protein
MDTTEEGLSVFDLLLSGQYDDLPKSVELEKCLPRLALLASHTHPSLYKTIYLFPELNRIYGYYQIQASNLRQVLQQTQKISPVEYLLHPPPSYNRAADITQFENGTQQEQLRIVAEELFRLYQLNNLELADDPASLLDTPELMDTSSTEDQLKFKGAGKEERKRKMLLKLREKKNQTSKLRKKQEAALLLPVISCATYSQFLCEIIPIIAFIIPPDPAHETLPSLSITVSEICLQTKLWKIILKITHIIFINRILLALHC